MRTRSMETNRAFLHLALATVAMLAVTLAAPGAAMAKEGFVADTSAKRPMLLSVIDPGVTVTGRDADRSASEDGRESTATASLQADDAGSDQGTDSLIVRANLADPEAGAWDGFRRSMAGAATSTCSGRYALAHQEFVAEGLLRVPFLVRGAVDGTCD
jgi:hypothetical protein